MIQCISQSKTLFFLDTFTENRIAVMLPKMIYLRRFGRFLVGFSVFLSLKLHDVRAQLLRVKFSALRWQVLWFLFKIPTLLCKIPTVLCKIPTLFWGLKFKKKCFQIEPSFSIVSGTDLWVMFDNFCNRKWRYVQRHCISLLNGVQIYLRIAICSKLL